jgi:signal transduction histidine kinase
MKIRTRLLIFNVAILTVTATALAATFFLFSEKFLHQIALGEINSTSQQALSILERFFEMRIAEQKNLSRSTFFFRPLKHDEIQARFEDYRNYFQTYQSISFYDTNRIRRIDLNRLDLLDAGSPVHVFDAAMKTPEPIMHFDLSNPLRPAVMFVTRIQKKDGPLKGFISAVVPLVSMQQALTGLAQPLSSQIRSDVQIFADDGTRIYSRLESQGLADPKLSIDSLDTLAENARRNPALARIIKNSDSKEVATLYESQAAYTAVYQRTGEEGQKSWRLALRVLKEDIERPITLIRYMFISLFISILLVALALNRWLSHSLFQPIEALTASLQTFDLNPAKPAVGEMDSQDEIGVLTRGLNEMTSRLRSNFAEVSSAAKFAALGEMAAGIAHEINNPLTVILGKAVLLESTARDSKLPVIEESSNKIVEMVVRISKTIHALRIYTRSGDTDPIGAEAVQSIIDSTLDICNERLRLSSIHLEVTVEPPDTLVLARPVQVSQILMNLLNNAHDALTSLPAEHNSEKNRWIKIDALETETDVRIAVENGGPLIPPQTARRLFEPFYTTKPIGAGTGIGLTISQRLATANNARIVFDETASVTRFVLIFPRADLELGNPITH